MKKSISLLLIFFGLVWSSVACSQAASPTPVPLKPQKRGENIMQETSESQQIANMQQYIPTMSSLNSEEKAEATTQLAQMQQNQ